MKSVSLSEMTNDQLEREYRESMSSYRYYVNTDDLNNWEREKVKREEARKRIDAIGHEFQMRGIQIPKVS